MSWPNRRDVADYDDPTETLLSRWHLVRTKRLGVYIHHLARSDSPRRPLHDHPWSFLSIRLRGNYTELMESEFKQIAKVRHRLWTFRRAEDRHRVVVDDEQRGAWTLVIRGRRRRDWGFQDPGESWVSHTKVFGGRPTQDAMG